MFWRMTQREMNAGSGTRLPVETFLRQTTSFDVDRFARSNSESFAMNLRGLNFEAYHFKAYSLHKDLTLSELIPEWIPPTSAAGLDVLSEILLGTTDNANYFVDGEVCKTSK